MPLCKCLFNQNYQGFGIGSVLYIFYTVHSTIACTDIELEPQLDS